MEKLMLTSSKWKVENRNWKHTQVACGCESYLVVYYRIPHGLATCDCDSSHVSAVSSLLVLIEIIQFGFLSRLKLATSLQQLVEPEQ
jgi:hypothetical protein